MEEPFTKEEIQKGIAAGVKRGTHRSRILRQRSLRLRQSGADGPAIVHFLPSAADGCCEETVEGETVKCDPNAPESAFVFKTVADPFVGKLSFVKVITGKLSAGIITHKRPHRCSRSVWASCCAAAPRSRTRLMPSAPAISVPSPSFPTP